MNTIAAQSVEQHRDKMHYYRANMIGEIEGAIGSLEARIEKINQLYMAKIDAWGEQAIKEASGTTSQDAEGTTSPPLYKEIAIETHYTPSAEETGVVYSTDATQTNVVALLVARTYYDERPMYHHYFYQNPRLVNVRVTAPGGYVPERDVAEVQKRAITSYLLCEGIGRNTSSGVEGHSYNVHVTVNHAGHETYWVAVVKGENSATHPEVLRLVRYKDMRSLPEELQFKREN